MTDMAYAVLGRELSEEVPDAFFGVMGEDIAGLTASLIDNGVDYWSAHHESVAVAMADGYSWASGDIGLAVISRGPGLTNALTAARTAARAGRRVLLVAGDIPRTGGHRPELKLIDQAKYAEAAGVAHFPAPDADSALAVLRHALAAARRGQPALFTVPADAFVSTAEWQPAGEDAQRPDVAPAESDAPGEPSALEIDAVISMLAGSSRPLVLAGRGATRPNTARALARLAEASGALLGTTMLAHGLFRGHPHDVGLIGGFTTDRVRPLLDEVDLALVFGASLTSWTTAHDTLLRDVPVVRVDTHPPCGDERFPIERAIVADAGVAAERLLAALPDRNGGRPRPRASQTLAAPLYDGPDESSSGRVDPRVVAARLDELLPEQRTVVLDGGGFMSFPCKYVRPAGLGTFRLSTEFGSIGLGLGTALGAAVARRDRPTVLFVGDGGLMQALGDLETAARIGAPLVIVVMNDHSFGAERAVLRKLGRSPCHADFPETDFASIATHLGLHAITIRAPSDLGEVATTLQNPQGPVLLDCRIVRDVSGGSVPRLAS